MSNINAMSQEQILSIPMFIAKDRFACNANTLSPPFTLFLKYPATENHYGQLLGSRGFSEKNYQPMIDDQHYNHNRYIDLNSKLQ